MSIHWILLKKVKQIRLFPLNLLFLPPMAGAADYLENIDTLTILYNSAEFSPYTAKITNVFSMVKSIPITVFITTAIITINVLVLTKRMKKKICKYLMTSYR